MLIKFLPNYTITPKTANCLMRIEAAKERIAYLPLTSKVLASLRETAKLCTTHYSTMIEGNSLNPDQINIVLKHEGHFPGRERDEKEVRGYFAALTQVEKIAVEDSSLTEKTIQTLHALVMGNGKTKVKPTFYRDGQNVIMDSRTRAIVYMPPEAKDVSKLMKGMVNWILDAKNIPCPLVAAIAHYQFATIHPYYDGNGRTARLLTTLLLHLGGYGLKGLYSLEEYYARDLDAYYAAISVGKSHNYYMDRAEADITQWVEYFINGMALSFEKILKNMSVAELHGFQDQSELLRKLDPKQRRALSLFQDCGVITSRQIGELFDLKPRTSSKICQSWVESGFLDIVNPSNRARTYKLSKKYKQLAES